MSGNFKPLFGTPVKRDHLLAPAACWLFNEGTGRYVWDATGNGNDGICTNMADPPTATSGWGPGPHGGALLLVGSNDHISCGSSSTVNFGTGSFTLSARFRTTGASFYYLIGKGGNGVGAGQEGYGIAVTNGTVYGFINDGTRLVFPAQGSGYNDGMWHHYIGVFDRSGNFTPYVDGVPLTATSIAARSASVSNAALPLYIGRYDAAVGGFFVGGIDSPTIYNRALSAEEIAYLRAFPYCMFEEEAFPAWMIPPLAVPQTVYGAARGVPILHGRGMRRHSESSRRPGQLSTTRRAG